MLNNFLRKILVVFHLSGARKILEPRVSSRMRMRVMFRSSSRAQLLYRGPSSDFQPAPLTTITCLSLVLYVVYTHNISFPFFLQEWPPYLGIRRRKKIVFPLHPWNVNPLFFVLFVPTGFGWIDTNLGWLIRYALFSQECLQQPLLSIRVIILSRFVVVESYDTHENVTVEEDMG